MNIKAFRIVIIILFLFIIVTGCQTETSKIPLATQTLPSETPQEIFTKTPPTSNPTQSSETEEILGHLAHIPIYQFFEESFYQLSLRYPEDLAELGVEESMGIETPLLNNVSQEYLRQTMGLEKGILVLLQNYDLETLTPKEQISYRVYEWYLQDLVDGHTFQNYEYIASYFILNSIHNQTFFFFIRNHPLNNQEQVENYIARLWLVNQKFDQIIEGLRIREQRGIIQPKFSLQWALYDLKNQTSSVPKQSPYYIRLEESLNSLSIPDDQKHSFLSQAEEAIEKSIIPAYAALEKELRYQESIAPEDIGLWQYEGGAEYYNYLLHHYTTTNLSAENIHQMGLEELERIHAEMQLEFDKLGYPQEENLQILFQQVAKESGFISSSQAVAFYEGLIDQAYQDLVVAFDKVPKAKVVVIGEPTGGYYVQGSLDGTRPGAFYAAIQGQGEPYYQMPSLTYHEAIPGHHFQIALAQEMALPTFRNHVSFTAYVEGWALYAERLASDLGWYQNDPYANLGRLQFEALRAARLVVDTGIHAMRWSFSQAVNFMVENVGWSKAESEDQIARYAVLPGQANAYMIGMLKILELREQAQIASGDQFELTQFHNQILSSGSMPLGLLEEYFRQVVSTPQE